MSSHSVAPAHLHEHRDVQGGAARAAVFGVSDGLVSNVGLILGVAGASTSSSAVQVAGIAGLVAGAISMAAGEYNSMRVQADLFEREISLERRELERNPAGEAEEMAHRYVSRGLNPDLARELADDLMDKPEVALEFHAREEIGVSPDDLGSPLGAAGWSLVAFSFGAITPLLPWFYTEGNYRGSGFHCPCSCCRRHHWLEYQLLHRRLTDKGCRPPAALHCGPGHDHLLYWISDRGLSKRQDRSVLTVRKPRRS